MTETKQDRKTSKSDKKDKIRGMLYGVALGDSLGAPYEFRCSLPVSKYTGCLEHKTKLMRRYQPALYFPPGCITDDTEMTMALIVSLKNGKYSGDSTINSYISWANSNMPMMGINTRELFKGIKTSRGYHSRYKKKFEGTDQKEWSQSNGSLMRCAPLALFTDREVIIDCKITNPHPINIECSLVHSRIIRELIKGNKSTEKILKSATHDIKEASVLKAIEMARNKEKRDLSHNKGWVVHALYCSVYVLLHHDDYEKAMEWVIKEHPRSDTDTTAAIAGAVMGAKLGYGKLWDEGKGATSVNIRVLLSIDTNRPTQYRATELDRYVEMLSNT